MNKKVFFGISIFFIIIFISFFVLRQNRDVKAPLENPQIVNEGGPEAESHPLSIASLKNGEYPGSDIVIEQVLEPGSNYQRYIASYKSEGLKIYALLTIPNEGKPVAGWPVIIFNHGFIPPAEYRTTERYIAYTDAFSRNGYIVFRSDYRGHGNSEGIGSTYGSNGYTIDVLNAVSSVKKLGKNSSPDLTLSLFPFPLADPSRIGMWGHSMGGHITMRNMVVNKDIKASVIWAGVVASYADMLNNWRRRNLSVTPSPGVSRGWRQGLVSQYGEPEKNSEFWNSISANAFLSDVDAPIQLHHGTADTSVPVAFSQNLHEELQKLGKESELYIYEGDDHDITASFGTAMQRSVDFFDKHLKN